MKGIESVKIQAGNAYSTPMLQWFRQSSIVHVTLRKGQCSQRSMVIPIGGLKVILFPRHMIQLNTGLPALPVRIALIFYKQRYSYTGWLPLINRLKTMGDRIIIKGNLENRGLLIFGYLGWIFVENCVVLGYRSQKVRHVMENLL